ncbi:MAG: 5-formyltetrahydrofolate cyclo-ligase [Aquabacterium sp.]
MAPTPPDARQPDPAPPPDRRTLRQRLLQARKAWSETPEASAAQLALQERVWQVLSQLEPDCLGIFWPVQGEFNPREAALKAQQQWRCRLALPFARRSPVGMDFRLWTGEPPSRQDECGIPTADGAPVVPDVVLVPCVGFTHSGWRLGYGGGYFDRYLAAHPQVTAIGVGWELGRLDENVLSPQAHDQPLVAVITESHTWGE